jgi:hypothetical protein
MQLAPGKETVVMQAKGTPLTKMQCQGGQAPHAIVMPVMPATPATPSPQAPVMPVMPAPQAPVMPMDTRDGSTTSTIDPTIHIFKQNFQAYRHNIPQKHM